MIFCNLIKFHFLHSWEQRKLKDLIVDLKSGLSRMLKNEDIGVPVVRANNIEDNKLDMNNDVKYWYNPDPQGAKIENYTIKKDDILINFINSEAKMGTATIVKKTPIRPIIYTTNILRMRTNTLLKPYFYLTHTNLQQYKNYIKQIMKPAVNQASFTTVDYKNYNLKIPKEDEQHKIELIFKNIDNLITLHQRECDQLKELKKSMLKKMFPRDESSIPEVRFAGFTDAWEQRKLREIAEFNPKSELPEEFEYVDLESVSGTEMISHRTELKKSAPSRAQRLAKTGDVFYQMVRPYQKKNYLFEKDDDNYVFSTGYAQMRPYIDSCFLMSFLQTDKFVKVVLDNCTGTSYPAINSNDLSNLKIDVPNKRMEEVKIGEYFRSLDNLITLHQRNYNSLNRCKFSKITKNLLISHMVFIRK